MKIKTIGTGGVPAKQRSSCTLIDNKILIDCGNGIVKTLLEQDVDINKIDVLLITHLHGDHFLDLPSLIIQRKIIQATNELNIYCPKETEQIVKGLLKYVNPDIKDWDKFKEVSKTNFIEFEKLENVEITKGYFVNSYEVIHGEFKPVYGFTLRKGTKSIGFSGDSIYCDSIETIVKETNISILDMTYIDNINNKHMSVHDIENIINRHNKKVIATHMNEQTRQFGIELKNNKLIIPNDGDEFTI